MAESVVTIDDLLEYSKTEKTLYARRKIAERINRLRERRGLSMQQLAKYIRVSQPTISRMLNAKQSITIPQLALLARVLRVHMFSLLTGEPLAVSRLIPPHVGETALKILGSTLASARLAAGFKLPEAAAGLKISPEELLGVEQSMTHPDDGFIERCALLYQQDPGDWLAISRLERDAPDKSREFARVKQAAAHLGRRILEANPKALANAGLDSLREAAEQGLAYWGSDLTGEPPPGYYSLGHLSDVVLAALQDPDFYNQVAAQAEAWAAVPGNAAPKKDTPVRRGKIASAPKNYADGEENETASAPQPPDAES